MSLTVTILGCGSSGGVPRIGSMWGNCDRNNPKNRRRRCALLVEQPVEGQGTTRVLVDTPADIREQLLACRTEALDAVFYTHDHADHTHGIDDLRMVAFAMKQRLNCYFDTATRESLVRRFDYCFEQQSGSSYRPILIPNTIAAGEETLIAGPGGSLAVKSIPQCHGDIASLGFRFGNIAYSPDVSDLTSEAEAMLQGLDVWIVDALRHHPHPSHFHVDAALSWIERLKPKRAVLTHMTGELDYDTLRRQLPDTVEPAFDGMVLSEA
jgi:phosphoribosyl 1,2-cyclic phosphate phosphodiesterase